jgi:hypothetical protein
MMICLQNIGDIRITEEKRRYGPWDEVKSEPQNMDRRIMHHHLLSLITMVIGVPCPSLSLSLSLALAC